MTRNEFSLSTFGAAAARSRRAPLVRAARSGIVMAAILLPCAGCLQLESSRTLAEEEDLRLRDKNTSQTREELEEKIRRELDHIRLLQNSLELTLTREEALHTELEKQEANLRTTLADKNKIAAEVEAQNAAAAQQQEELKQLQAGAQELANSVAAERSRIAATEEILKRESQRIELVWLRIAQASAELEQLQAEETRLLREVEAGRERIWRARQLLSEAEAALSGDRKELEDIKRRIERLLQEAPSAAGTNNF